MRGNILGCAAALLIPSMAQAFCGTYIGGAGDALYNDASQIVIARQEGQTTLTLVNDYSGDLKEFAMVIPVPTVLREEDVRTVDGDLVATAAKFSAPREVAYECDDFSPPPRRIQLGCAAQDFSIARVSLAEPPASTVMVESEFSVGIYDIVVLSAEESSDLMLWLESNGYGVDPEAEDLLSEYIESGSFFFAAKVNLADQVVDGQDKPAWLEPLQFTYSSESFSLPIRLGTLNSRGSQDLLMYILSSYDKGQVGISNYPEVTVPRDCMLGEGQDMGEYIDEQFDLAVENAGGTAWAVEHSWTPYHCDPCTGPILGDDVIQDLGFTGESPWFTRLHVRYRSDADQDLMLYETQQQDTAQSRMIQYNPEIAHGFNFCDAETTLPEKGFKTCKHLDEVPKQAEMSLVPIVWMGTLSLFGVGMMRRRRF